MRYVPTWLKLLALALTVLAVVVLAVGVVYLVVPAKSLTIVPGHIAGNNHHRTRRGIGVAIIGGVILVLAGAAWYAIVRRRGRVL